MGTDKFNFKTVSVSFSKSFYRSIQKSLVKAVSVKKTLDKYTDTALKFK